MLKTAALAFGATLLAASAPAFAEPAKTAPEASPQPTEISTAPAAKIAKPMRYCVVDYVTGSRLPSRKCNTREDWLAQGFDPLAK